MIAAAARPGTQVAITPEERLEHASWIVCDDLVSLRKSALAHDLRSPHSEAREVD